MQFEWDEVTSRSNIRKHGIDFTDVVEIFKHTVLTAAHGRQDFGEDRWIAVRWMQLIVAVVVYVERREHTIRIISARKATRPEIERYGTCARALSRFTAARRQQGEEHTS